MSENDLTGGELFQRTAWVIHALAKKCKPKLHGDMYDTDLQPHDNVNALSKLMSGVGWLSVHKELPDREIPSAAKIEPITDTHLRGHVQQAINRIWNLQQVPIEDLAEKAFIPHTKFKRGLTQLGLNFLNDVSRKIPESIPEQPDSVCATAE